MKASNNSHFHSSYIFALYFSSQYQWSFSLFVIFLSRKLKEMRSESPYRKDSTTKLSPVLRGSYLDGSPNMNPPCCKNLFLFSFPFKGGIKDCRTPSLVWCRFFYFSTTCSSFRHDRIHADNFTCIYLQHRINKNSETRPVVLILLNSLDFWSSKTITSILLLSVALLKPCCHH